MSTSSERQAAHRGGAELAGARGIEQVGAQGEQGLAAEQAAGQRLAVLHGVAQRLGQQQGAEVVGGGLIPEALQSGDDLVARVAGDDGGGDGADRGAGDPVGGDAGGVEGGDDAGVIGAERVAAGQH